MDPRNISLSSPPPFGPSSRSRRASLGNEKERIALEGKRERIALESKREREEIFFEKRIGKKRPFLPDPSPCEEKRREGEEEGEQKREEEWLKRGKVERAKEVRKGEGKEETEKGREEESRNEDSCHSMKDQEQEQRATRVPSPGVVLVDEVVQVGPSSASGVGKSASGVGKSASGVGKSASGVGKSASGVGKRVPTMGRKRRKRSGSTNSSSSVFTPTIPYKPSLPPHSPSSSLPSHSPS